ncbi:MAG: hypothetical protein M0Q46_04140 [Endomicrobiales bacterium]|nr:hypothetical protein [Endomicrobiales bacterium]
MNILVRNLSKIVTEEELMEKFRPFGVVTSVTIVMDNLTGLSKGFGFVEMPGQHEAEAAIRALDRTRILKDKIKVKKTNAKLRSGDSPEYNKPQTTTAQPTIRQESGTSQPTQAVRPMFKPGYIKHHSRQISANANSKFPPKDSARKEYSPRGERPSGQHSSARRSSKPYGQFTNRNNSSSRTAWPAPLGERSAHNVGARKSYDSKRRDSAPSQFPSRDAGRQEFKPRSERPFGQHSSGERSSKPYGQFAKRDNSSRPAWPAPRGERPAYKTFSKPFDPKRRDGAPSRFPSSDTARKEYSPRGEKPSGTHSSGERGSKPFSKFAKGNSGRPSWPAPRGARPRFK